MKEYFVVMSDGKTTFRVSDTQFHEIRVAMESNQKFYTIIKENIDKNENININLSNVISFNEINKNEEPKKESFTPEQKDELVKNAFESVEGRIALVESMANPIQKSLIYRATGRKILLTNPLAVNEKAEYTSPVKPDSMTTFLYVDKKGKVFVKEAKKINVPLFDIKAKTTSKLDAISEIFKAQTELEQQISQKEDFYVFKLLEKVVELNGRLINACDNRLVIEDVNLAFAKVEETRLPVMKIILNSRRFADIRSWGKDFWGKNLFDCVTQKEVLLTGVFGRLWTADIIINDSIPDEIVYFCSEAVFTGAIPIKTEIQMNFKMLKNKTMNIMAKEKLGFCVTNINAIAAIKI